MSIQISKIGKGTPANRNRGIVVPVTGTWNGSPFQAQVYLGVSHNCTETEVLTGNPEMLSDDDAGELVITAMGCPEYVQAILPTTQQ